LVREIRYQFQIPELGVNFPACSETLVPIPTTEKGNPLVEVQELQENIFCSSSIVECRNSSFLCLIINSNSTNETLKKFPRTQELPKLSSRFQDATKKESHTRNQMLQAQLRLAHIKKEKKKLGRYCGIYRCV